MDCGAGRGYKTQVAAALTITDPGTSSTTQWTYLAMTRSGSLYFRGAIDELAFYPTALSSSRIYAYSAAR